MFRHRAVGEVLFCDGFGVFCKVDDEVVAEGNNSGAGIDESVSVAGDGGALEDGARGDLAKVSAAITRPYVPVQARGGQDLHGLSPADTLYPVEGEDVHGGSHFHEIIVKTVQGHERLQVAHRVVLGGLGVTPFDGCEPVVAGELRLVVILLGILGFRFGGLPLAFSLLGRTGVLRGGGGGGFLFCLFYGDIFHEFLDDLNVDVPVVLQFGSV